MQVIKASELYNYYDEMITKNIKGLEHVDIFKERWDEGEFEYKMESLGIKVVNFCGGTEGDYYEYGVEDAFTAVKLKTNIVLLSNFRFEKLIIIFADDIKQAKEKIDMLFNYIVETKKKIVPSDETIKNDNLKKDGEKAEKAMLEYLLKKYGVPKEFLR